MIKNGVNLHKVVQKPREFVIARAAAYHAGFNSGFNIAEAVNFALPSWLDIADNVSYCKCAKDSVRIDMNLFRKRLRGEPIEDDKPQPEIKRTMCAVKSMAPKAIEVKKPEPKKKRDEKAERKQEIKIKTVVKEAEPERKEGESSVNPISNVSMIVTTKKVKVKAPAKVEKPKSKSVEKKSPPKKAPAPSKPKTVTPKIVTIKKPEPQPKQETLVPKKRVRPSRAKV